MGCVLSEKKVRIRLRRRAAWGRLSLLVMVAVTLVNQLLLALNVKYHFLWSAAVPYYLNWGLREMGAQGTAPLLAGVLTVGLYGAFLACWLLSGRRRVWLSAALGLYAVDTLLLIIFAATLLKNPSSCILEILVHGVLLALLIVAVRARGQLSRMPKLRRDSGAASRKREHFEN